jgi:hypothetical protein
VAALDLRHNHRGIKIPATCARAIDADSAKVHHLGYGLGILKDEFNPVGQHKHSASKVLDGLSAGFANHNGLARACR